MFQERTHFGQRQSGITHADHKPERREAELFHHDKQGHQQRAMDKPHRHIPEFQMAKGATGAGERLGNIQQRG
ncbi:hypothetical protein D3C71_1887410 [compost metagenome]